MTKVKDLMTRAVETCAVQDRLDAVARLMWEHDCGSVPVVDDAGRVVGMITDRDICMAAYTQGKPLMELGVAGAMATTVRCCSAEDSLATAEETMRAHQVRRLPVIDAEEKLVGILSLNDLACAAERQRARRTRADVTPEGISQTLAAICARHTSIAA